MGDAAGMESHPDDTTDAERRLGADVLTLPIRRLQLPDIPPSVGRDPRQFPYGLLIVERCIAGGVNGFHWFATEAEAVHFLREGLWHWVRDDETSEWVRSLYVEALCSTSRIDDDWLLELSEQQDEVLVIWHGRFDTLISGGDTFAAAMLADYQGRATGVPLACAADINAFIQHLPSYRG
jgi:hypothetical protein